MPAPATNRRGIAFGANSAVISNMLGGTGRLNVRLPVIAPSAAPSPKAAIIRWSPLLGWLCTDTHGPRPSTLAVIFNTLTEHGSTNGDNVFTRVRTSRNLR